MQARITTTNSDGPSLRGARLHAAAPVLVAGIAAYLIWRSTALGSGATLAIALPLLIIEIWSATQFAALVLLTRTAPGHAPPTRAWFRLDVVVTTDGRSLDDLEQTLVACRALPGQRSIEVLDSSASATVAAIADAHHATLRTGGSHPLDDPRALFSHSDHHTVLWLDAGQTPMPDVDLATGWLRDPDVAVVQIGASLLNTDSLAHVDRGRDEHAVMREVVGPALSTRGVAPWLGAGSVVRRTPLLALPAAADTTPPSLERTLVRLHAAGMTTRFDQRPLVRAAAPDSLDDYLHERRVHVARQLAVLRSTDSPLTGRGVPARVRLAHLAALSRHGVGIRLVAAVGIACAVLVTGTVPTTAAPATTVLAWATVAAATSVARHRLTRGALAPGDSLRNGWRTAGADLVAIVDVARGRRSGDRTGPAATKGATQGLAALGRLRLLTASIVALDLALLARGATMFRADLLPAFTPAARLVTSLIGLALLVPMVDVLQLVATRRQRRGQFRAAAAVPIDVDGHRAVTVDLAPSGVGFVLPDAPEPDALLAIGLHLPRLDGSTSLVPAMARVRSVVPVSGGHRIGAEIVGIAPPARLELIAYCAIDHPFAARAEQTVPVITAADLDPETGRSRRPVAVLSTVAVVFGLATAAAGPSAYAAAAAAPVRVCSFATDGSPDVGAVVSIDTPAPPAPVATDHSGCAVFEGLSGTAEVTIDDGSQTHTRTVEVTETPVVVVGSEAISVEVVDPTGLRLPGITTRLRVGESWRDGPRTHPIDGRSTFGVGTGRYAVEVSIADQRVVTELDVRGPVTLAIAVSTIFADEGVALGEISTGTSWRPFVDGMSVLAGPIAVRAVDGSVHKLMIEPGTTVSVPSGRVRRSAPSMPVDPPPPPSPITDPTPGPTPAPTAPPTVAPVLATPTSPPTPAAAVPVAPVTPSVDPTVTPPTEAPS